MHTLNYYNCAGYCAIYGMSETEFLKELKYDPHAFCEEYDLHFYIEKVNGKYTITKKDDDENYSSYENQIKNQEIYDKRINVAQNSVLASVIVVASIFIWEQRHYINEKVNDTTNYVKEKASQTTRYINEIFAF